MTAGVYAIANHRTGMLYIGSTVNLKSRWMAHCVQLRAGRHSKRLQADWDSYEVDSFTVEIVEAIDGDKAALCVAEQRWLDRLFAEQPTTLYNTRKRAWHGGETPFRERTPRLKAARESQGLSRAQLAKQAGLSATVIGRAEKGHRVEDATLEKLCRALGVSVGDILEYRP